MRRTVEGLESRLATGTHTDRAGLWARDLLRAGPLPATEVHRLALDAGWAWRTLKRAKARAHVRSRRRGGRWFWELER